MTTLPTIDMMRTGNRIKELRTQTGLSVRQLQEIFGFETPQAIYKWQQGISMPTVDNLVILSKIFNTNIDNIIVTTNKLS